MTSSGRSRGSRARAIVSLVVITGEAGTGKSRLAREFAGSLPPPWSVCTATITRTRAALPDVPGRAAAGAGRSTTRTSSTRARSPRCPTLDGVLIVLTFRLGVHAAGGAEMRALAALVAEPRACELRLTPLSPAGVEQMAAAMGRYADAEVYGRTGGNPFWSEQVLGGSDAVPWTVVEAVTAQLDALPEAARDLARALAVADEALPPAAGARLVADLDAAWTALAGLAGPDLALRHALVGETIRAGMGPDERARWHARVAAALEPEPVAADRVARHWAAAGETERAATIARAAVADLRAQGATRRAFECYELALRRHGGRRAVRGGRGDRGADRRVRGDAALDRGRRALLPRRRPRRPRGPDAARPGVRLPARPPLLRDPRRAGRAAARRRPGGDGRG